MDATIVIPQYQNSDLTRRCLASLRTHEPVRWPVIVVDDGSTIAECGWGPPGEPSDVRFVRVRHRGVTAAWNIGVRLAETEYVVLVNNDVVWKGPSVDLLVQPLRDGSARICGAEWRRESRRPASLSAAGAPRFLVAGWCLAFSKPSWRDVGGFDESLALYFSDTDFQWRLLSRQEANGSQGLAVCDVPLTHIGHATTRGLPDRCAQWRRDRERFLEKWS